MTLFFFCFNLELSLRGSKTLQKSARIFYLSDFCYLSKKKTLQICCGHTNAWRFFQTTQEITLGKMKKGRKFLNSFRGGLWLKIESKSPPSETRPKNLFFPFQFSNYWAQALNLPIHFVIALKVVEKQCADSLFFSNFQRWFMSSATLVFLQKKICFKAKVSRKAFWKMATVVL